ncbi:MAG: flagellar hook protein FlgE [Thermodesulfobacteriota bacterium]
MLTSLYSGISGLNANSTSMDVIGDNIANLNTTAFKSSRVNFGDVLSQTMIGSAGSSQIGRGVAVKSVSTLFTQGSFEATGNALDLAIDGDGLFIVTDGTNRFFTRAGQFALDKNQKVVNSDGFILQGYQADETGTVTGTVGDITFFNQQSQPVSTTEANLSVNLDATETIQTDAFTLDGNGDGVVNDPANYNHCTTMQIYDSLGGTHDVTMYFCKTADGTWDVHYVHQDPTDPDLLVDAGTQTLTFNTEGALTDDNEAAINFDFGTGVLNPQPITFNYGTSIAEGGTGLDGTTQYASDFSVNQQSQDGYGAGTVSSISIAEDGLITASFTNGRTRTVGQIALARFNDPSSLIKMGGNLYAETYDSGQALIGRPETSGLGRILSHTLEASNVDLAQEFVKLISAQRAFQANSRIITTTDEMMQELVNIKR